MISNILAHQRADHGMMYNNNNNRDSSIGIFGNLREQIFNLQKDLHVERHSSNVREMVISSMAAKIGMLEEELNKSEAQRKILESEVEQSSTTQKKQPNTNSSNGKKKKLIEEQKNKEKKSELTKFNETLDKDLSKSLATLPTINLIENIGARQSWTKIMANTTDPVEKKPEVWNWLGKTIVIDRSGGLNRAPPASHTRRLRQLRENKKQQQHPQQNVIQTKGEKEEEKAADNKNGDTSWQHELLYKHHSDFLKQPKWEAKKKTVDHNALFSGYGASSDSEGEEEKVTDPIMNEMNKIPGYQQEGDQGAEDVEATVTGKWTEHQSGGINSMVNPQALLYFKESGIHRVKITLERPKKLKRCGLIFFVYKHEEGEKKRVYLGDPSDELEEREAGKNFKSKASRKLKSTLVTSLKGGKRHRYCILCCLEKPGKLSDFTLTVTNTNGDAEPKLKMLPPLTHSKQIGGEWRGPTAAPMKLFADQSDPTLCSPNIKSPQYLLKVDEGSTTMITVSCEDSGVVDKACLNAFVYLHDEDNRKMRFPRKDLIVHQEGYLDGNTVTAVAKLQGGRTYVVSPCIMLEEQGAGAKDIEPREGSFTLKVQGTEAMTLKELPEFESSDSKNEKEIACTDIIHPLRRADHDERLKHGAGKYIKWNSFTLSEDPSEEIAMACEKSGGKFIDEDFPPENISINKDPNDHQLPTHKWARLSDICDDPKLFTDGIDPDDVLQGELGNCWFCAAMAAIAWKRPALLKRCFVNANMKFKNGFIVVKIYDIHYEEDRYVVVDDYIPVDDDFNPYFARTRDPNECWPIILEKVFAKLHGCYQWMAGHCKQCLKIGPVIQCLTKAKVQKILTNEIEAYSKEDIWANIIDTLSCKGIMECSTRKHKATFKLGLVCFHAYTIIGVEEVLGNRLLRIRNTWGHSEWRGDWSDGDEKNWTAEMKRAVTSYVDADDGAFYISYDDFLIHYDKLYLGKLPDKGGDYTSTDETDDLSYHDKIKGYWNAPYANGFSTENPQYLVKLKGKRDRVTNCSLELRISSSQYNKDHKKSTRARHELSIIVCMPNGSKRIDDLGDKVIFQEKSSKKTVLKNILIPKNVSQFIIIPCWGNVNGNGNEPEDEGSFKLAISCNFNFDIRPLVGEKSKRGKNRDNDPVVIPNSFLGRVGKHIHDTAAQIGAAIGNYFRPDHKDH